MSSRVELFLDALYGLFELASRSAIGSELVTHIVLIVTVAMDFTYLPLVQGS